MPSNGRFVGVASSSRTASSQPSSLVGSRPFSALTLTFVPQPFSAILTSIRASFPSADLGPTRDEVLAAMESAGSPAAAG